VLGDQDAYSIVRTIEVAAADEGEHGKAEGRGQRVEGRGQRVEGRGQRAEGKILQKLFDPPWPPLKRGEPELQTTFEVVKSPLSKSPLLRGI